MGENAIQLGACLVRRSGATRPRPSRLAWAPRFALDAISGHFLIHCVLPRCGSKPELAQYDTFFNFLLTNDAEITIFTIMINMVKYDCGCCRCPKNVRIWANGAAFLGS